MTPAAKKAPAKKPLAKAATAKKAVKKAAKPVAKKAAARPTAAKSSTKSTKPLAKSSVRATSKRPSSTTTAKKATPATPMATKKPATKKPAAKATSPKPTTKKAPAKKASVSKADAASDTEISSALEAKLIKLGRSKAGVLSYDELNKYLPADEFSPEIIDELITRLASKGVKVLEPGEDDKADASFTDGDEESSSEGGEGDVVIEVEAEKEESYGRSDDPVRMYLREMGNVELLSREGEIEIAKRIESGREMVISSLCESPTVMHMVLSWRDKLAASEMLLREMIDLDATYGAGTADKFADAELNKDDDVNDEEEEEDEYDALEGGRKEKVEADEYDDEAVL